MKIKDVIVCDDIRTELSNKFSLMGIYFDKVRFTSPKAPVFPVPLRLGLMIRLFVSEADNFPQQFKIRYHIDNDEVIVVEGEVKLEKGKLKTLNLPIMAVVPITKLGTLRFDLQFSKDNEETYSFSDIHPIEITSDSQQLSFSVPPTV